VQVAGGLYVLLLAWKAYLAWRDYQPAALEAGAGPARQTVLQAALVNLLSPGPYIFWSMIAGPLVVRGWSEAPARGAAFVLGFYAAMLASLAALAVLFGTARQLGPRVSRALLGLSALALGGFGLYQLVTGLAG
jgi:threonine/homoserine/homoserine lactone efflux protein